MRIQHVTALKRTSHIKQCSLMVINEISVCYRRIVKGTDHTFCDIRANGKPFERIITIFAGDWKQVLL